MSKGLKNKQGSVFILVLAVVMCVLLPIMAVIFDVGRYRMYQQDIKNAQDIAALACVGVSGGSIGQSTALGSFDLSNCQKVARQSAFSNLGQDGLAKSVTLSRPAAQTAELQQKVKKVHGNASALQPCTTTGGQGVDVSVTKVPKGTGMLIQIKGLCFRPMFINSKLLNFQVAKTSFRFTPQFKDEYPVMVSPTPISAVYDAKK